VQAQPAKKDADCIRAARAIPVIAGF